MAFEFRPGRFYLGMWYLDVPPALHPPHGGNLTALVWKESGATNGWVLQYRHRYYANRTDPPGMTPSNDRFSWYRTSPMDITAAHAIEAMTRFFHMIFGNIPELAGTKPDVFWIRGDRMRFFQLTRDSKTRPYWMHVGEAPTDFKPPE